MKRYGSLHNFIINNAFEDKSDDSRIFNLEVVRLPKEEEQVFNIFMRLNESRRELIVSEGCFPFFTRGKIGKGEDYSFMLAQHLKAETFSDVLELVDWLHVITNLKSSMEF